MLERPAKDGERAILVHINLGLEEEREQLSEFRELAKSAGAQSLSEVTGSRTSPDKKYFIGKGKVDELLNLVEVHQAEIVLFNHSLSPSQERNLEQALECRVLDRTGLILDIFAQRARSFEGKLQVELAQLQNLSSRLVRGWTHLERQKGGIGLRGPGETQLETDRRLIMNRIKQLKKKLSKVHDQRNLGKRARQRSETPTVSLVGYTNAGKSTLFNQLTGAEVYEANQLFATLDPTLRKLTADGEPSADIILSDTVGFIRHLPHELIEAFSSTLEETRDASLLLHVIDAQDPERNVYIEQVNLVLQEIKADQVPQIRIYNKIDLTDVKPHIEYNQDNMPVAVWVSAHSGAGLDLLRQIILTHFEGQMCEVFVRVPVNAGKTYAKLRSLNIIRNESVTKYGDWVLSLEVNVKQLQRLEADNNYEFEVMSNKPLANKASAS